MREKDIVKRISQFVGITLKGSKDKLGVSKNEDATTQQ